MLFTDTLQTHSIKDISQQTNISEENLHALAEGKFDGFKKVKTLGFISILEREYNTTLNELRQQASEYYIRNETQDDFLPTLLTTEEGKKKSLAFVVVILAILGYASWYFFTEFDKKHLNKMIPFSDTEQIESILVPEVEYLILQPNVTNAEADNKAIVIGDENVSEALQDDALELLQ